MAQAQVRWRESFRIEGLPEEWDRDIDLVDATGQLLWRIYLQPIEGVWMAFAESADGETLVRLLMVPRSVATRRRMLEEAQSRV